LAVTSPQPKPGWPPAGHPAPAGGEAQRWWAVEQILLDCLCTRLANTIAGPVCVCTPIPGDQAIADYCGAGPNGVGQAWVRLSRVFMTRQFPQPITTAPCPDGFWAAEYELGVLRCAATLDDEGQPPSPAALAWDAAMATDDAAAVMDTGQCCLPKGLPRLVGDWRPMQGGGCTGGTATVTVHLVPGPIHGLAAQETGR
jgi:hypothetical protein